MTKKEHIGRYGHNQALINSRHDLGLSRADVAYAVGMTKAGLTRIEDGQRFGDWSTMARLARFYHKTVDDLFFKDLTRRAKYHRFYYKLETSEERRDREAKEAKERLAKSEAFDRKYHITDEDMEEVYRQADEHHKSIASN